MWQWLQARIARNRQINTCLDAVVRESRDYIVPLTISQAGQRLCWRLAADYAVVVSLDEACYLAERRLSKEMKR